MALDLPQPMTIPFDRFWSWLRRHRNCVLRVGTVDAYIYDHDQAHWQLFEDEEGQRVVQLGFAKQTVSEIVIGPMEKLFVHTVPDPSEDNPERTMFEVITSEPGDDGVLYHFLLTHGFDEAAPHASAIQH